MARVFTTRFAFNHQLHDAIVTVTSHQGQLQFTVRLMDPDLLQLLPDGQISYTGRDGISQVKAGNHLSESLIQCIAVSVEQHLSVQP